MLAGTFLTALVGIYVFPYNWSFNFAMTFGSILAATDPVAVSALMNEVGAPPRLKIHVSGESMLNDGSAVVLFTIFSGMVLSDIGQDIGRSDLGEVVDVGKAFVIFFQMSLGGAAIGIAFGLCLLYLLQILSNRLGKEENVIQVTATVGIAYLTFFVSEIVAKCSGVIAVVMCGITVRAFGSHNINDGHMMENFWSLLEHLLNSLLFALGGVVWGETIAIGSFTATDWGYLFLLYILLQVIRFFLMFAFYPVFSRIGLGSKVKEAVFLSFGGLRGAVGIALAISLTEEVWQVTEQGKDKIADDAHKLFGMVGGVAFLTLFINGTLCGPLIRKMGLTRSSKIRQQVVKHYLGTARHHILEDFIHLMTRSRFFSVDFSVVNHHVEILEGLTIAELDDAVQWNKEHVPSREYREPYIGKIIPFLTRPSNDEMNGSTNTATRRQTLLSQADREKGLMRSIIHHTFNEPTNRGPARRSQIAHNIPDMTAVELRHMFIECIRAAYQSQVEKGVLDGRGFLDYGLFQSLEFADDEVSDGKPLNDWSHVPFSGSKMMAPADGVNYVMHKMKISCCGLGKWSTRHANATKVQAAMCFIGAHQYAQQTWIAEFNESEEFGMEQNAVLRESEAQVAKVKEFLESFDESEVQHIVSHFTCTILLNKTARFIENLCSQGLLYPREIHGCIDDIQEALNDVRHCTTCKHSGELTTEETKALVSHPSFIEKIKKYTHVRDAFVYHGENDDLNVLVEQAEKNASAT